MPDETICELHRQLYEGIRHNFPKADLIAILERSYKLAKKIDVKLRQYKFGYSDEWYQKNKNYTGTIEG